MFDFTHRKHDREIAFAFHIGYLSDFHIFHIVINFYKYQLNFDWTRNV